jgi:DNA-binding HxlR family transcriptional regulator
MTKACEDHSRLDTEIQLSYTAVMPPINFADPTCGIALSLEVLGERWSLLIVRQAFFGETRFSGFRSSLGVSPDILTARLATLVEYGALERHSYQAAGERERDEYLLTAAGRELVPVLAALGAWGSKHRPMERGQVRTTYRTEDTGEPVTLAFITADGRAVETSSVTMTKAAVPA